MAENTTMSEELRIKLHAICDIEDYFARYEALVELIGHDPRMDELFEVKASRIINLKGWQE